MDRWIERFNSDGEKAIAIHDGSDFLDTCFEGEREYDVMNALAEYEDLEEQGLLVRLPRKVGGSVFIIVGKDISKQGIRKIEISDNGIIFKTNRQKRIFNISEFGKTVFLTREEAEKKLEELKNEI